MQVVQQMSSGLIIENPQDEKSIKSAVKQIQSVLATNFVIDEHDILLKASVGVSVFPDDAQKSTDLYMHASIALYHAKLSDEIPLCFIHMK